jgi:hypothetical protein
VFDGMDISGASGGSADAAGFDVATGPNGVLGVSFTGGSIDPGDGLLTSLSGSFTDFGVTLNGIIVTTDSEGFLHLSGDGASGSTDATADCAGDANGDAVEDECGVCNGSGIADGACDCDGNVDAGCGCGEAGPSGCDNACGSDAVEDECGVCGGDGIADGACDCDGNVDAGCGCGEAGPSGCDNACGSDLVNDECGVCGGNCSLVDVLYNSDVDIAGFQFNVVPPGNVLGASGGAAADAGFTVSTSSSMVLGFSFSGAVIPAGSGVLTVLQVDGGEACLSDLVLTGVGAVSLDASVEDCLTISYSSPVLGCTDSAACNYDGDADEHEPSSSSASPS